MEGNTPLLFETMVFNLENEVADENFDQVRYASWIEADAGHAQMVEFVRKKIYN